MMLIIKENGLLKKVTNCSAPNLKVLSSTIGEDEIVYTPGSASELKKAQETPLNFVNKYLDSNGFIKDAEGYHRL